MFILQDALQRAGLDLSHKIKLVRHAPEQTIAGLWRAGRLDEFEAVQGPQFGSNFEYLISFIASGQNEATFLWVKKKISHSDRRSAKVLRVDLDSSEYDKDGYYFHLEKSPVLREYEGRFRIDWPHRIRPYQAILGNCDPIRLTEMRSDLLRFRYPGWSRVELGFSDLEAMRANPEGYPEWQAALSSTGGIYLISARESSNLYVGSATGADGIWGRWMDYAATGGNGGNVRLREVMKQNVAIRDALRWTILYPTSLSADREDVLRLEASFCARLGSRAFGLNG